MTPVPVNYLAVLIAAVASMVVGFLWYGPIFGKAWIKLMGWSEKDIEVAKAKGDMNKSYAIQALGSLIMSYVLAHALIFASTYTKTSGISAGVMAGFFNWLGFIAPVSLGLVLWEGQSWKLWFFKNAYYLVTLSIMGIILSYWY